MADTIKSVSELKIDYAFYDGDSRTVTVENPKDELPVNLVHNMVDKFVEGKVIIGDKNSAHITGINSLKRVDTTRAWLDFEKPTPATQKKTP